jgi:hypothetical protein
MMIGKCCVDSISEKKIKVLNSVKIATFSCHTGRGVIERKMK